MLALARRKGERILIGDSVLVGVAEVRGDKVILGVWAPSEISIIREELIGKPGRREPSSGPPELKPIETAPKDGTWILLFGPSGYKTTPLRCEVGRWYPEARPHNPWQTHSNDAFNDGGDEPTHWMELPQKKEQITGCDD